MIIAVANRRGSVRKTTTSQAMATRLANQKYLVLSTDLGPWGNFSATCGAIHYNVPMFYKPMK